MEYPLKVRVTLGTIGIIILVLGLNILIYVNLGLSAFDTFCYTISKVLNISFGNGSLLVHLCLMFITILMIRIKAIEVIVALVTVLLSTRLIDLIASIYELIGFDNIIYNNSHIFFILGFLIFGFGMFLMLESKLICTPLEWSTIALSKRINIKIGSSKFICELCMIVISIILIYTFEIKEGIGIGTVLIIGGLGLYINVLKKLNFKLKNI